MGKPTGPFRASRSIPTEPTLLPCPFCGGRAFSIGVGDTDGIYGPRNGYWLIGCDSDDCDVQPEAEDPIRAEAERQWNRRASETPNG